MMVPRPNEVAQTPSHDTPTTEWRVRCLLALSLLNHRAKTDGLGAVDVEAVRGALLGEWSV